jgi:hypothetical protein
VGGVPRGRVVEIFGPESGGKTTLALHIVAEAQKLGGQAAFTTRTRPDVYLRKKSASHGRLARSPAYTGEALESPRPWSERCLRCPGGGLRAALVPKATEGAMATPRWASRRASCLGPAQADGRQQ